MYEKFIRDRIFELRIKKGVSEYKMSTDMGHSKSYIQRYLYPYYLIMRGSDSYERYTIQRTK